MGVRALRLERSILRRWPKAAAVTSPRILAEQGGSGRSRGMSSTTADETFGGGVNAPAQVHHRAPGAPWEITAKRP